MNPSPWRPKWWVFLPLAFPALAMLWHMLGTAMQLPVIPGMADTSGQPAWLVSGYHVVQHLLWMCLSPGALMTLWVANAIHADLRALPPWVFWVSVSFSVAVECLFLYVVLLLTRWEHFWRARE